MIYAERYVTRREKINKHGKIGYPLYREYFKTNDPAFFEKQNRGKRKKFQLTEPDRWFDEIPPDEVHELKVLFPA